MRGLCQVYGLNVRHAVRFEHRVKGMGRKTVNFVDEGVPNFV